MFGLGGGMDPKKMQALMKQMGIKQEEIDASRVVIEKKDGGKLIVENPSVQKISMQGQESLQVMGEIREEDEGFSEADIELIMEKTGKGREEVTETLKETGDLAEAIERLS